MDLALKRPSWPVILRSLAFFTVYFISAKLGLKLAFVNASATAVWPPTGIALAALLVLGMGYWPVIFLGAFLVNFTTAGSFGTSVAIGVGNTLEAVVGTLLVTRLANGRHAFERINDILRFALFAEVVATLLSPAIGVTSLCVAGFATWDKFIPVAFTWWMGDLSGALIIAPFLLLWSNGYRPTWRAVLAVLPPFLFLIAAEKLVFMSWVFTDVHALTLKFLCIPPLIWMAFQFGRRVTATGILLLSTLSLLDTLGYSGPAMQISDNERLLTLQVFMGVISITCLSLAAAVAERRAADEGMARAQKAERSLRSVLNMLQLLQSVTTAANRAATLEEAVEAALPLICRYIDWPIGHVYYTEKNGPPHLVPGRQWYMSDEKKFSRFRKITERSSLERGQGLPGTIAASGKPQWFTDLPGHPNFPRSIGALESGLRTGFGFPVFLRGELVAILEFFTDKDIPEDRDLLENVAYMGIQLGRVAERQAAELEESRLAALVERSSDFIITTDPEGKVLYLNQAGKRMVGLEDHPNLQALKREDFIFPDDIPRLNTEVLAVMTRTGHWEGEFRLKNFKTGAAVPVYFSATALLDPATGQPAILAAIGHDITERKKAELAIQESEQKFRLLVANTPDYALYLLDPEGRVITWNEGAEKLKGYTAAEIIGRNYSIFFTEEDHERGIPQALLKEAETKGRATYETRHIRKDGSVFWADSVLTSVVNPEGRLQGFAKITHDVTERQERAVKLREADLRFRSLVQSSTNAIIIADGQGLILSWNRGARDIFGHEEPEVIGQPLTLIMPERYREAHRAGLRHLFETGVGRLMGQTLELQGLRKNGEEFPIELTLSNWSVEGQTYFGGIIRDITERKKVEELLRSNSELQQFANIASHDLQEPLRMVSSYVQLLSARYGDRLDEDARDYIAFAVDGAKRMHQLINALLEYSRVQGRPNPFERVDLNQVFDQVVLDLAMRIQETGAKITHGPLPEVKADTAQMAQLLQNLFVNAMKFRKKDINPVIHLSAAEEKGEWVFTCQDNGIGIDPKYAERIFMIFQRLHHREEYEGTGMGLAICKRIVERHGGRIWVESKPGEGASFRFTFPMTN